MGAKSYVVWVEVEEYDAKTDKYRNVDLVFAGCAEFGGEEEAVSFAERLHLVGAAMAGGAEPLRVGVLVDNGMVDSEDVIANVPVDARVLDMDQVRQIGPVIVTRRELYREEVTKLTKWVNTGIEDDNDEEKGDADAKTEVDA